MEFLYLTLITISVIVLSENQKITKGAHLGRQISSDKNHPNGNPTINPS